MAGISVTLVLLIIVFFWAGFLSGRYIGAGRDQRAAVKAMQSQSHFTSKQGSIKVYRDGRVEVTPKN